MPLILLKRLHGYWLRGYYLILVNANARGRPKKWRIGWRCFIIFGWLLPHLSWPGFLILLCCFIIMRPCSLLLMFWWTVGVLQRPIRPVQGRFVPSARAGSARECRGTGVVLPRILEDEVNIKPLKLICLIYSLFFCLYIGTFHKCILICVADVKSGREQQATGNGGNRQQENLMSHYCFIES